MAIINKKCKAAPSDILKLAVQLGVSNATAAVLINRGIDSEEIGRQFLDCDDSLINDPFEMLGMYEAVDFISEAVELGRQITIYGDYDVDGITSVSILYRYLKSIGAVVNCYIPNRFTEGYGMNREAVMKISARGSEIIIALDCGITSVSEVNLAKELGLDVMIVDHHTPPEDLPDADIIVNPKQKYCRYPFKELCSAGLALKIVEAHGGRDDAKKYYDIAAIGTVADIVPLQNENRYYVKAGIEKINKNPFCGVKALKAVAGYADKNINARGIAFGMAPRLNAAGRMATAKDGLKLFITDDYKEAYEYAVKLNDYNDERRQVEKEIYDSSIEQLKNIDICEKKIIISCGEGWNKGVIGIAASRFVEKYNRPSIVIACNDDLCTASARSIPGFNIYDALYSCRDLFTKFGGHSGAAGFSLPRINIPEFIERIEAYADANIREDMLIPAIDCECRLSPADIDMKMAKELQKLEPFGKDNESPLFYSDRLEFNNATIIGKDKNVLRTAIDAGGLTIDCVGFGKSDYIDAVNCKANKSAVFSVDINTWQGIEKVQLALKELRLGVYSESDIDYIADAMNDRLFEAFRGGFVSGRKTVDAELNINDVWAEVSKHSMGSLIVVTDKISLRELLLNVVKDGFSDKIDVHIGTLPAGHEFGANTILAMPYKSCIAKGEFSRVYVSDYAEKDIFENIGNVEYYKAHDSFAEEKMLERSTMAAIYKALHDIAYKLTTWNHIDTIRKTVSDCAKLDVSVFALKEVFGVFSELEFLKYEEADGMIRAFFADNVKKRQLAESSLYEKYMKYLMKRGQ